MQIQIKFPPFFQMLRYIYTKSKFLAFSQTYTEFQDLTWNSLIYSPTFPWPVAPLPISALWKLTLYRLLVANYPACSRPRLSQQTTVSANRSWIREAWRWTYPVQLNEAKRQRHAGWSSLGSGNYVAGQCLKVRNNCNISLQLNIQNYITEFYGASEMLI